MAHLPPENPWLSGPHHSRGYWLWRADQESLRIRFVGRGPSASCQEVLRSVSESPAQAAWLRQIHSRRVAAARPGVSGEGDALVTNQQGLALTIVSADCVPIVLAAADQIGAIHAGWRGIVDGVIAATLEHFTGDPLRVSAWIGPAIGACCYEVSDRLAELLARASCPEVVVPGKRDRPHVDLPRAAASQLRRAGVGDIRLLIRCTRCDAEHLWSYRREGEHGGRNHAFVWRSDP